VSYWIAADLGGNAWITARLTGSQRARTGFLVLKYDPQGNLRFVGPTAAWPSAWSPIPAATPMSSATADYCGPVATTRLGSTMKYQSRLPSTAPAPST
jgi:hypothetical protein